jgi:hypothetical protein
MKTDDLKIGYWYKHIPDERIGRVERFNSDGTPVMYALAFDCEISSVEPDRLNPATLDDLAVILAGRECWFITSGVNQSGFHVLDMYSRHNGIMKFRTIGTTTWGADYNIAIALAAAVNAPVITREQWKELTDE